MSQWLYVGLHKAGFDVVLLETRHVKGQNPCGIAQLLRMGWIPPVHCKFPLAQEVHALFTARK